MPHFAREALESALKNAGIAYRHFPDLGGRRSQREADSPNTGWRVEAFNAYADYMLTGKFDSAFADLTKLAGGSRTAIMCAEAVPWRCHRRLISDQLVVCGWRVYDILGMKGGAKLYSQLTWLYEQLKDADGQPTQGIKELYEEQSAQLKKYKKRWQMLVKEDITQFNALARKLELPGVIVPAKK